MPGIGQKTAERLACYVLKQPVEDAMQLAYAIRDAKKLVKICSVCFNISENELCQICADANRDKSKICVIEQVPDLLVIEKTDRKSTRLNSSHSQISYAVFCLKKQEI